MFYFILLVLVLVKYCISDLIILLLHKVNSMPYRLAAKAIFLCHKSIPTFCALVKLYFKLSSSEFFMHRYIHKHTLAGVILTHCVQVHSPSVNATAVLNSFMCQND